MKLIGLVLVAVTAGMVFPVAALAARPEQKREQADLIIVGTVTKVYSHESKGYRSYIVEMKVEEVEKGAGIAKRETFRAFCYQRKEGFGGLEFDTAGHKQVPKEGERIKAFVNRATGLYEGVYSDWYDLLPAVKK